MNNLLATVITGLVIDENAKHILYKDGVTFMFDKAEGEHKIGDMVKGFAYRYASKARDNSRCCYNSHKQVGEL